MEGYSGKPLAAKLEIGPGSAVHLVRAPDNYRALLDPLPERASLEAPTPSTADIVHVFSTRRAELADILGELRHTVSSSAIVWVSWPKRSAKVPTDITEDVIREVALPSGSSM